MDWPDDIIVVCSENHDWWIAVNFMIMFKMWDRGRCLKNPRVATIKT